MVVGNENVGKTTILDCLFPLKSWVKTKGDIRKTPYFMTLQGKMLKKYKDPSLPPHKEWSIENREWSILQEGHRGILLENLKKECKPIKMHFEDEKTRELWFQRLKRLVINEATHGIEIQDQILQGEITHSKKLEVSIWDFAGQHDYYNNHHYFLSVRSVFLVLWRMDQGDKGLQSLEFWLKSLSIYLPSKSMKKGSPLKGTYFSIIVVGTFLDHPNVLQDSTNRKKQVLDIAMKQGYDEDEINYIEVSCFTLQNIETLKNSICSLALTHSYMGEKVPSSYLVVEKSIQDLQETHRRLPIIQIEELLNYCLEHSQINFDIELIKRGLQLLHEWGKCIYFANHEELSRLVITKPEFLTKDILSGLFRADLSLRKKRFKGVINHSDLHFFWPHFHQLSPTLINLLQQFEVCFILESENEEFYSKQSLIPSLLPETIVDSDLEFEFVEVWSSEIPDGVFQIERIFNFNVVPSELVSRLLVRFYKKIHKKIVWRTGVLLKFNETFAYLSVDMENGTVNILIRSKDSNDSKTMIEYITEEIKMACRTYLGLTSSQVVKSPYVESSFIDLEEVIEDSKKPFEERQLLCPETKIPIKSEILLVKAGLSEILNETQMPKQNFDYFNFIPNEKDNHLKFIDVFEGDQIFNNEIHSILESLLNKMNVEMDRIQKVIAIDNKEMRKAFSFYINNMSDQYRKFTSHRQQDWLLEPYLPLRKAYMESFGKLMSKFRNESWNYGSHVPFFFFSFLFFFFLSLEDFYYLLLLIFKSMKYSIIK